MAIAESQYSPARAVVETDRPCANCGYNLRTLPKDGNCPECGWEVQRSLRAVSFASAGWYWLARSALGLGMLIAAWGAVTVAIEPAAYGTAWHMGVALTVGAAGARTTVAGYILNG